MRRQQRGGNDTNDYEPMDNSEREREEPTEPLSAGPPAPQQATSPIPTGHHRVRP